MAEGLTNKQIVFIEHYLFCWNATEAARQAGYAYPNVEGPKNLVKPSIQGYIQARLNELKMSADEVLTRLTAHARGSIGAFVSTDEDGTPNGFSLKEDRPLHLVKKVSVTDKGWSFEMYDAQAALALLGKHHGLFVDRTELTGKDGNPIEAKFINALDTVYPSDE